VAALTPVFRGSTIARDDLVAHARQVDEELAQGNVPAEAQRVYGHHDAYYTVRQHDAFTRQFRRYNFNQPNLGEIVARCQQTKTQLEISSARLEAREGRMFAATMGGLGLGFAGFVTAAAIGTPLGIAVGVLVGVAGLASFVTGITGALILPERRRSQIADLGQFSSTLEAWGRELDSMAFLAGAASGAAAAAPNQPAASEPADSATASSAPPTASLTLDEKKQLVQQLLRDIKQEEEKVPPRVEKKPGRVEVDGVSIPVKP